LRRVFERREEWRCALRRIERTASASNSPSVGGGVHEISNRRGRREAEFFQLGKKKWKSPEVRGRPVIARFEARIRSEQSDKQEIFTFERKKEANQRAPLMASEYSDERGRRKNALGINGRRKKEREEMPRSRTVVRSGKIREITRPAPRGLKSGVCKRHGHVGRRRKDCSREA